MNEYKLNAFASAENKMFGNDLTIFVNADTLEEAKIKAVNNLSESLAFLGLEVEANYDICQVVAIGKEYEDVFYGFDED